MHGFLWKEVIRASSRRDEKEEEEEEEDYETKEN